MTSIRKKLIILILSVLFGATLLMATATYFIVREEVDEVFDENLKQVAHTILNTGPSVETQNLQAPFGTKLRGEEKYLTQVWRNGVLKYSSYPHVELPLQEKDGRGRVLFNDSKWRYYKQSNGDISVQLAQDLKERHSVVVEIYGFLLIPIALQFPILAGLIWVMVGYGLKPLSDISHLIRNRNPQFLDALPEENVPVEISDLVSELNDLLKRLKDALESQRRFTADAAHELRTPLAAVRLQLDILKRADDEEEAKAALLTLEKGVLRSTRLVHQLLELARQEPENVDAPFARADLAHIVEDIIEQSMPIAEAKNISLTAKITDRSTIIGNGPKLNVMVGNLISNAITYTKDGGHIEVTLRTDRDAVMLEVADDGIGIKPQDRDRVFDRFYRVVGTGTTGSGLGLSIVRSIADAHYADIDITDGINGEGTTFRVRFKKPA